MERALVLFPDAENPTRGDLRLVNGQSVFCTSLLEEVAQRLLVRFNFWKTEWFRNTRLGLPWLDILGVKDVLSQVIHSVFSQVILGTEGVAGLDRLTFSLTGRELDLQFTARLEDGTTFVSSKYGPYVVTI